MVGLLDLPLELREPILLDVVIDTIQEQPEHPGMVGFHRGYHEIFTDVASGVTCKPLHRHVMALLQINQQIRFEVTGLVLRRLGKRFDDAEVDVMYVQHTRAEINTRLCATWLSVPFPTTHLNSLHVQLRFFQAFKRRVRHLTVTALNFGGDCQHWLESENAAKLLDFVHMSLRTEAGNASSHEYKRLPSAHERLKTNRTIQKLVIDIPFDSDPRHSLGGPVHCMLCPGTGINFSEKEFHPIVPSGKRAALVFAKSLHEQLLHTFDTVPAHWVQDPLPTIIFGIVGRIEVQVQGRLFRSLELSQILATMPHSEEWNEPTFSRAKFFKWKRGVEDKRRAAGFEVVKPSVQEHNLAGSAGMICSILAARDETLVPQGALPTGQSLWPEIDAFTGNAVLVQEDGTKVPGDATFYVSMSYDLDEITLNTINGDIVQGTPPSPFFDNFLGSDLTGRDLESQPVEDRPEDGEHVVFKGEAIVITTYHGHQTITSGDATFYGRAEDAST